MLLYCMLAFIMFLAIGLLFYTFLLPHPEQPPRPLHKWPRWSRWEKYAGRAAYIVAYILSLLRTPLGLLPYLVKLFIFFVLKIRYESAQSTYFREVINMLGDFVNLGLTLSFVLLLGGPPHMESLAIILYLPIAAEFVRLTTERVPLIFSAFWQLLPHRPFALFLRTQCIVPCWLTHYCQYYTLSDTERAAYVLRILKQLAIGDEDMTKRLSYIQAFRIVPQEHGLRSGSVRDVARGEVFIHAIWTNDPWLLIGMAMRRAPWMFDPRYLRRPFYYMTGANRLATLFVLAHARYSIPYAIFQFGHEIRVARLHCFYGLLRWLGIDIEYKVNADGTFQFDQWIDWLLRRCGQPGRPPGIAPTSQTKRSSVPPGRPLYTDDEVIADLLHNHDAGERNKLKPLQSVAMDAQQIAIRYTYPMQYVEEVLLPKIAAAKDR